MKIRVWLSAMPFLWIALGSPQGRAAAIARYALVIGNNHGSAAGIELPDLQHAEAEAQQLREALIRWGHFEPDRTLLLIGQSRPEILAAAERLAEIRRRDIRSSAELPTLFALFYSGHGVMRQLLTQDQPLTGEDIAAIYRRMDATVSIGFFDACFSGSLDSEAGVGKGLVSRPGFNPLTELPQELLNTEGTMWFVSSQPNELSFEDPEIGGVLTHFFIRAFTEAPIDGAGIPLDAMWEYARRATTEHMARRNRRQTPEKIVRHLKAKGPLIFSFPRARTARLLFSENTEGAFLLQYAQGALTERIDKSPGVRQEVAVFDGEVTLVQLAERDQAAVATQHFNLQPDGQAVVHAQDDPDPFAAPGYRSTLLQGKGRLEGLQISEKSPALSWGLQAGYRYQWLRSDRLVIADHLATVGGMAVLGDWVAQLDLSFGQRQVRFDRWSAWVNEWGVNLSAGRRLFADPVAISALASLTLALFEVDYRDGERRLFLGGWFGGRLQARLNLPLRHPWVLIGLFFELGGRWSQGLAFSDRETYLVLEPRAGAFVQVPF